MSAIEKTLKTTSKHVFNVAGVHYDRDDTDEYERQSKRLLTPLGRPKSLLQEMSGLRWVPHVHHYDPKKRVARYVFRDHGLIRYTITNVSRQQFQAISAASDRLPHLDYELFYAAARKALGVDVIDIAECGEGPFNAGGTDA